MSKINLKRMLLGGVVAGIVFLVLGFASYFFYLGDEWKAVMEDLGYPTTEEPEKLINYFVDKENLDALVFA